MARKTVLESLERREATLRALIEELKAEAIEDAAARKADIEAHEAELADVTSSLATLRNGGS